MGVRHRGILYAVLGLLVFLGGCATAQHRGGGMEYLNDLCRRYMIRSSWDSISQVVTLNKGSVTASALVGSPVVIIGDQRVNLSAPLRKERGMILVPADFEAKVLSAFSGSPRATVRRGIKIVVDPGHGGKDPGAQSKGVKEKAVVLDISQRLREELQKRGFTVVMTRDRDVFITLAERTEIAARNRADLFVSIHANSSPSKSASGSEIYSLRNLTADEKREAQRQKNSQTLFRGLSMERSDSVEDTIEDMMYQYKQAESASMAGHISRGMSVSARINDRGSRQSAFFVLRNTLIPAVLVEVGFLSNTKEQKLLGSPAHRQKVAEGIAEGIAAAVNRDW